MLPHSFLQASPLAFVADHERLTDSSPRGVPFRLIAYPSNTHSRLPGAQRADQGTKAEHYAFATGPYRDKNGSLFKAIFNIPRPDAQEQWNTAQRL